MKCFHHHQVGYWETRDDVPQRYIDAYPDGTVEVPQRPVREGYHYTWNGSGWDEHRDPVTSEIVNIERDRRLNAGVVYQGCEYDTDAKARENIASASALALGAMIADASGADGLRWSDPDVDFTWIAANNSRVPMTAAECYAFCQAVLSYASSIQTAARTLKDTDPIPGDATDDKHWPSRTLD